MSVVLGYIKNPISVSERPEYTASSRGVLCGRNHHTLFLQLSEHIQYGVQLPSEGLQLTALPLSQSLPAYYLRLLLLLHH